MKLIESEEWIKYPMVEAHPNESALEADASMWASYWHKDQVRKYTGEPYICHPAEVASIVRTVPHTEEMLAAAWLHDVVEDCGVHPHAIITDFGNVVAKYVYELTDASRSRDGNRAARKAIDLKHTAKACPEAMTIKLADIISNSQSILVNDANFAKVYLPEKRALLNILTHGDPTLWAQADKICREAGY